MLSRRAFLGTASTGLAATIWLSATEPPLPQRKKLAVVRTRWNDRSQAWHTAERFLYGYPLAGRWHHPPLEVVAAYVDPIGYDDLSRQF